MKKKKTHIEGKEKHPMKFPEGLCAGAEISALSHNISSTRSSCQCLNVPSACFIMSTVVLHIATSHMSLVVVGFEAK